MGTKRAFISASRSGRTDVPEMLSVVVASGRCNGYFAIVHPLCGRLSRWRSVTIIGALWSCSALLSLPPLLYSRTRSYRYADGSVRTVCILVWPDGPPYASYDDYV
ncbi:hypothetical protein MTO96_007996 [Rhipicephalus appendiculatus]